MEPRRSLGVPRPSHSHSQTHAGGIQPPASFFRPSKPNHGPGQSLKPIDVGVNESSSVIDIQAEDGGNTNSNGEELMASGEQRRSLELNGANQTANTEPIPSVSTPPHTRTSFSQGRPTSPPTHTSATPPPTTRSRTRSSLEAIFNLRRGNSARKTVVEEHAMKQSSQRTRKSFGTGTFTEDEEMEMDEEQSIGYPAFSGVGSGRGRKYIPPSPSLSPSHSRSHSRLAHPSQFNPNKPPAHPPLNAVPMIDPKAPSKALRNYRLHPSRNGFFLDGRILTGGDTPWAFIACFGIVIGIAGTWFGTTCVWWWRGDGFGGVGGKAVAIVGAYACLIVISNMLATAFTDPGILPRDLDPEPPYPATTPANGDKVPLPRDLKVRSDVVRCKYCPTCRTYRPPRSSHCKMCDNCVDDCDHHCQWVNNCIGRRNYGTFFTLLLFGVITDILVLVTSALHLAIEAYRRGSFKDSISSPLGIGSAVAFSLAVSVIWPVTALLAYHVRLLLLNITTIEQIRNQAHKTLIPGQAPPNPFSHGTWKRNLFAVLGRPRGYSWLSPRGVATEDRREVNPGLVGMVGRA